METVTLVPGMPHFKPIQIIHRCKGAVNMMQIQYRFTLVVNACANMV